jgi:hypothetical protein
MTDTPRELADRDRRRAEPHELRMPVVTVSRWHRFVPCTWTRWDPPRLASIYQYRRCIVCGKETSRAT